MAHDVNEFTVLAFDYGLARTGVAVGNSILKTAQALTIIQARDHATRFAALERLMTDWDAQVCVVGLPCHPDGAPHQMTQNCQRFAQRLQGRYPKIKVVLVDERYTSVLSSDDAHAAALILQQYFDQAK